MSFDYADYDGLALAELVRRGEVTPRELAEAAIARASDLNPQLNAIIFEAYDQALERAETIPSDGQFVGVPCLLKDILADQEGWPTTLGSRFMKGVKSGSTSELTRRFLTAGLNPIGKTNVPELGLLPVTEPVAYGATRNPWNLNHTPGGSSGGSAAAVAAGIVPIAHANDGGGSIRIPASCCGLVGLKPTRARNPKGPLMGDIMSGLVEEHVLTRTVRDCAAVLDATSGPDIGDPYFAPPSPSSYLALAGRDPEQLRIAFTTVNPRTGQKMHPECVAAVENAVKLCEDLGHRVQEVSPQYDAHGFDAIFSTIWFAGAAYSIDGMVVISGKTADQDQFEPFTWASAEAGRALAAPEYLLSIAYMQQVSRAVAQFFQHHDAFITATLGEPPAKIGWLDTSANEVGAVMNGMSSYVLQTHLFNATGGPSISLPLHWTEEGLPVGVMVSGDLGADDVLIALAGQLERALPWNERRPPIWR